MYLISHSVKKIILSFIQGLLLSAIIATLTISFASIFYADEASSTGESFVNQVQRPNATIWAPEGDRFASQEETLGTILPEADRFVTIHGGVRSADEINIAFAPVFEQSFTSEERAYVPEGPSFLSNGTILFTPLFPSSEPGSTTNFTVIAIDSETGERLWTVGPGQLGQGGAPLVLNDPDGDREVVYSGGYESVYAIDLNNGTVIWETPTGLSTDPETVGLPINLSTTHLYGANYHPRTDSVLFEYGSGNILSFDRQTGTLLGSFDFKAAPFNARPTEPINNPQLNELIAVGEDVFAAAFDAPTGESSLSQLFDILLGNNTIIANYFAVDPDTDSVYVTSTLNDGHEGDSTTGDGFSEDGALYRLDLTRTSNAVAFDVVCNVPFEGGSASTPSLSPDGERIYTADNESNVLAFDKQCNRAWSIDVGEQVFGSLSVSSTGGEIYASNANGVFKIQESPDRQSAKLVFDADLSGAFSATPITSQFERVADLVKSQSTDLELRTANINLSTLGENGAMIQSALSLFIPSLNLDLPLIISMSLIDRETGAVINATEAREETVSALSTNPDGVTAIGNSPFRRVLLFALLESVRSSLPEGDDRRLMDEVLNEVLTPLTGGVTKYGVKSGFDLLARDASCSASKRLQNTLVNVSSAIGVIADIKDSQRLIRQANEALNDASSNDEITEQRQRFLTRTLGNASEALDDNDVAGAIQDLASVCRRLGG